MMTMLVNVVVVRPRSRSFSSRRRMQRSNSISGALGVVALLLLLVLLVANGGGVVVNAAEKKECIDIEDLSELRELISENDLFVYLVHESETSSSTYDELCNRYTNTPNDRVGNLIMGKVTVKEKGYDTMGNLKENDNRDIAKLVLGKKKSSSNDIEEYFIFLKNTVLSPMPGEKGLFKYSSAEGKNAQDDEAIVTPDALTEFIETNVPNTGKLGTWVYSLYPMDTITQLFVANSNTASDNNNNLWWRKFLAYNAKCLAYTMKFRIFKTSAQSTKPDIADLYVKAMFQTIKHGNTYATKQISRMEKMMEKDSSKLSLEKKEEISQKIHILQKFTNNADNENDAVVTMSTYGKFLLQIIMTISSVVLLPAMIVYVIFGSLFGDSDEEEPVVEKESEEEKEEEGKDDDGDDNKKKEADKTEESE